MEEDFSIGSGLSPINSVGSEEDFVGSLEEEIEEIQINLDRELESFNQAAEERQSEQDSLDSMATPTAGQGAGSTPLSGGSNPPTTAATGAFEVWTDADDKVQVPRAGGLMMVDSEPMAYTGHDPDSKVNIYSYVYDPSDATKGSWQCPKNLHNSSYKNHKGPLHVGQFRPTNVKEKRKVKTSCSTFAGTTKYGGSNKKNGDNNNIPLRDYVRTARKHMVENGMWSVFQYTDPISNKTFNLFDNLGEIKFYDLKVYIQDFKQKEADFYDLENLDWSGQWFRNSLTANFLRSILLKVDLEASGPEMLVAIFESMHYMDAQAAQALEAQLKSLTLASFAGENVPKCNQEITRILQLLDSANFYRPDMLGTVMRIYTASKQPSFVHWAYTKKQKIDAYVSLCQQYKNDEKNVPNGKITYTSILDEAQKHYDAEALNKSWKPMMGVKPTPSEPDVPGANTAAKNQDDLIAAVATAVGKAMKQQGGNQGGGQSNGGSSGGGGNGSGGNRRGRRNGRRQGQGGGDTGSSGNSNSGSSNSQKRDICNWCGRKSCNGKEGYSKCPHKDTDWYKIQPEQNQATVRKKYRMSDKKTLDVMWCSKCKQWRYQDQGGHTQKKHAKYLEDKKKYFERKNAESNQAQHDGDDAEEEEQEPSDVDPDPWEDDKDDDGEDEENNTGDSDPWGTMACAWNEV